jgi:hypothetical protein
MVTYFFPRWRARKYLKANSYYIILSRWRTSDCEISGWGMQQYNNSESYPDSGNISFHQAHDNVSLIAFNKNSPSLFLVYWGEQFPYDFFIKFLKLSFYI